MKIDFRFFVAKKGFFSLLPKVEANGMPHEIPNTSAYWAESRLFLKVIDQALHDLGSSDEGVKEEAEDWFDPKNEDFQLVCELSGLNHKFVYKAVKLHLDALVKSREPMKRVLKKYNVKTPEEFMKVIVNDDGLYR